MTTFPTAMADALRLTKAGRLLEATHAIQAALAGRPGPASSATDASKATVIDLVARRSSEPAARPSAAKPELVSGFASGMFTGAAGSLGYRLYVPVDARPGMPLVVMLHGCTQNAEDFATGTGMNRVADDQGFLVAYPTQSRSANAQGCWNWFKPGDQRRDGGEPALIAGLTRQIIASHAVDPARVYVAGLSAGGAAAAIMGAAYPDIYAAIGVHSGLACGSARDLPSALAAMRRGATAPTTARGRAVPVITFHGDADRTVDAVNSRQIIAAASGTVARMTSDDGVGVGGRRYTRETGIDADGHVVFEQWTLHGAGHAWSGGDPRGSYADAAGPSASREMARFFLAHRLAPSAAA